MRFGTAARAFHATQHASRTLLHASPYLQRPAESQVNAAGITCALKHSLQESVNKMPNEIGKTRYYKTIFLYETIRMLNLYETLRRLKYSILQKKYRDNSFGKAFDWNWEEINFNRIALVDLSCWERMRI